MPAPTFALTTIDAGPRTLGLLDANLRALPAIRPSIQAAPLPPAALSAGTLTQTLRTTYSTRFFILNTSRVFFGNGAANYAGTIPSGTIDGEIDMVVLVSKLISLILVSDQDVTLKTNSTTTPQETIALAANVPLFWNSEDNGPSPLPYAGNVSKFYVTASSASPAAGLHLAHLLDLRA